VPGYSRDDFMIDRNLSGARDSVLERRPGQLRNGGSRTALLGSQKISAALNTDASRCSGYLHLLARNLQMPERDIHRESPFHAGMVKWNAAPPPV
jgi:hypothetical protein